MSLAADSDTPGSQESLVSLLRFWKRDMLSGFLVFLIALPLCLGISIASGYPAVAGIFTAIIGAVVATFLSNSELTIKGPAAGLIVIVLGAVMEMRTTFGLAEDDLLGPYRLALAIGVAAGVVQILFGLLRSGVLGEFFPTAAVHGLLASIGVIIMSKQIHNVLGVTTTADGRAISKLEPLQAIAQIPDSLTRWNPEIAMIGAIGLLIMFGVPLIKSRWAKMVPTQMLVVLMAIPFSLYFDLDHLHTYSFLGTEHTVGPKGYLPDVPKTLVSAVYFPDWRALETVAGWKWVMMFALIGSLESLLSSKAVELLDPWRRKGDMNRDLLAVGVGNTLASLVGGLPMISEIVRSKANIDNGARSRFGNFWHGMFLLGFVSAVPELIHKIPLAALAAMLVFTGFRLASPREFMHMYHVGREQLVVFVTTIVAVLATDLLIGILIGMAAEFAINLWSGAPFRSLFRPTIDIEENADGSVTLLVKHSAVFSSWISLRKRIERAEHGKEVVLNLSDAKVVDHTVMEKLHELQREFEERDARLVITGLDGHRAVSEHPRSARLKGAARVELDPPTPIDMSLAEAKNPQLD